MLAKSIFNPICRSPFDRIFDQISTAGFSPLSLFASGEQGAWYDPSDLSTLFQDAAGTTPVTSAGQPVGLMRDKSGRGNHATQVAEGRKPMLRNTGALWYLEFDGVDDFLVTGNINFSSTNKMSVFSGLRKLLEGATGVVVELSAISDTSDGSFAVTSPTGLAGNSFSFQSRGTILRGNALAGSLAAPVTAVLTAQSVIVPANNATRKNGADVSTSTGTQGTGNYGNYPMYLGRRGGATLPFTGYLYGLVVRGAITDATGITNTEKYLAAKSGVTL